MKYDDYKVPTFIPSRYFSDSRGWSQFNIFPGISGGQINVGTLMEGSIKAFHYHKRQKDLWNCISGDIHVICAEPKYIGIHSSYEMTSEKDSDIYHFYIGEHNPGVLIIPELFSHGYCNVGSGKSTLLYWVTNAYDAANPDEERVPWDCFGKEIWDSENK
jgi:dTDP-4-dehydrorhamnose 3,5-epimerase